MVSLAKVCKLLKNQVLDRYHPATAVPAGRGNQESGFFILEIYILKLYHVTTQKKAKLYRQTGHIIKPVRGFNTLMGAMAWAIKVGKKIIYEIETNDKKTHKLPDHHNEFGEAWWADDNIINFRCIYSGDKN